MIQIVNGNYIRRTASGVMKCGPSLSFGSEVRNKYWDLHFKEIDAKMKRDKKGHGYWTPGAPFK